MATVLGELGVCIKIPVVRASMMYKRIREYGYTLTKPTDVLKIPVGSAVCVPLKYYANIYFHWGVVVDNGVIHYNGNPVSIQHTSWDEFAYGDVTNVRVAMMPRSAHHAAAILERLSVRIGESNYNIFINNCESLVMWAYFGKEYSHQVTMWLSYLIKRFSIT